MGTFFHGWRRKAGCLSLVIALLSTVGWGRSFLVEDEIIWRSQTVAYFLGSRSGFADFETNTYPETVKNSWEVFPTGWRTQRGDWIEPPDTSIEPFDKFESDDVQWRFRWGGFDFGSEKGDTRPFTISHCQIPYWSIVLPVTLLSGWLLLSKPQTTDKTES
jgi:hypothetical protein